ncbi:MAG: hypothetical protein AB4042_02230 [Leptolyngbyaceae cyanobacterium]
MASPRRSSSSSLAVRRQSSALIRSRPRRSARPAQSTRSQGTELWLMIGVNLMIATIAGLTILRLRDYNAEQQVKLQDLEVELTTLERRVDHLRRDFTSYFDPQQTRSNMRILSDRVEAGQRKVVLIDPSPSSWQPTEIPANPQQ